MKGKLGSEALSTRIQMLKKARDEAVKNVDNLHVKLQDGNSKTGKACFTVSFLPVVDCSNCQCCKHQCYDIKNVCSPIHPQVIADRAKNSAIHLIDPDRFWDEVELQMKANYVYFLRINVGGDLNDADFSFIASIGKRNPKTHIMFFTKNYKGINTYMEENTFPDNVHPILSVWKDLEVNNPHNLPCAHVIYNDGSTTAPEYGAYLCTGNCSECAFEDKGCWTLKNGEHVAFHEH